MSVAQESIQPDLNDALYRVFGFAEFRPLQAEAVEAALEGRDVLVVMPTGAGKSLTFQLPAAYAEGVTVVISPLIALMRDQILALRERTSFAELGAAYLNSSQSAEEQRDILMLLRADKLKLLYVAPERLRSPAFIETLRETRVARLVVDEAHCISEWGHDFRPDYLAIGGFLDQLGHPPVSAVTATATLRVQESIAHNLGMRDPAIFAGGFNRANLHYSALRCKSDLERDNRLFKALPKLVGRGGSGLIYCPTRKTCERVVDLANQALAPLGQRAGIYHAGMESGARHAMQESWLNGEFPVLVATNAFGMGIDKPDVRFVIHYGFPESPEAYYQEAGRAGRDGRRSRCVILSVTAVDRKLREFFIDNEGITGADLQAVQQKLAACGEGVIRIPREWWQREFGWRDSRPRVILGKLERAGLLERYGEGADASALRVLKEEIPGPLLRKLDAQLDLERQERHNRLGEMLGYVRTRGCRRRVMLDYFGDHEDFSHEFCCDNCDAGLTGQEQHSTADLPEGRVSAPPAIATMHDLLQGLDALWPNVGKSRLCRILRGSRARDEEKFSEATIFGALRGVSVARIGEFLDDLVAHGLLHQGDEDEYFVMRVTRAGREAWRNEEPIAVRWPGAGNRELTSLAVEDAELDEEDDRLFERLRTWRRNQALRENLPPYCVFSDKVLRSLARERPTSAEELRGVSGVGDAKLGKYGDAVLEVILNS